LGYQGVTIVADDEKTIFSPGLGGLNTDPNATIMIPNPGRRLRQEESVAPPAGQAHEAAPASQHYPRVKVQLKSQSNAILSAANTLIAVLSAVSNSMSHPNIAQLQQEMATEMGNLDTELKRTGVRNEEALTARYILCSAIDEAVMDTPWGVDSGWGQRSLLRIYHNETSGGERFFELLDQLLARRQEYGNLLELFYVLLCMGFKGKYQLDSAGDSRLDTLRERLHQDLYGDTRYERLLSDPARLESIAQPSLRSRVPLWVVLSVSLAFTLLVYTGLRAWMYSGTVDVTHSFDSIYFIDKEN
jgi:type VI secretion system protein ImpK